MQNNISDILREREEALSGFHEREIDDLYAELKDKDKEIACLKEKIWELQTELAGPNK